MMKLVDKWLIWLGLKKRRLQDLTPYQRLIIMSLADTNNLWHKAEPLHNQTKDLWD